MLRMPCQHNVEPAPKGFSDGLEGPGTEYDDTSLLGSLFEHFFVGRACPIREMRLVPGDHPICRYGHHHRNLHISAGSCKTMVSRLHNEALA